MLISQRLPDATVRGKLIFVEGLPGTGKSSTAQRIWRQLQMKDVDARWYHESVPSPLTTMGSLERLVYRTSRLVDRAIRRDLADGLHWWLSRRSWARFGARKEFDGDVLIFDARVFMGVVRQQLSRDVNQAEIKARVLELLGYVRVHAPVLVFLVPADIERLVRSTIDTRGPAFEEKLVSVTARCRYGRSRGIAGLQAVLRYWEDYLAICRDLVEVWPGPRIVATTDVDRASRQRAYDEVESFLGISDRKRSTDSRPWSGYVGTYESEEGALHVRLQDGELTMLGEMKEVGSRDDPRRGMKSDGYLRALTVYPRPRPLMARGENEFDIEGLPFVARFASDPPHDLTLSVYLQSGRPNTYRRRSETESGRGS